MNKNVSRMLLAGAIGCATVAFASSTATVTFTNLPYTDLNGNYGSADATYNGYVIATVNGTPDQLLICDD
ncbi:MAG: hypothetical protein WAJ87_03905, partial [Bryobacteraceae bacterium]